PQVTGSSTNEDVPTTTGLVVTRNAADGAEITQFQITDVSHGKLFKSDGTTQITVGSFITAAEGNAGLRFIPDANFSGTASISVLATLAGGAAPSGVTTATILVSPVDDPPDAVNDAFTASGRLPLKPTVLPVLANDVNLDGPQA